MDARETALQVLAEQERLGGWTDERLAAALARARLAPRDAALATRLCFGVQQNRTLLDFYLGHFSRMSLKRMETRVRLALELGAFQMLFLDRIPHSAAVDTSVRLARAGSRNPRAAGMVNGVLRALERALDALPPIPTEEPAEELSIRFSHPRWLTETFLGLYGREGAEALLAADNEPVPVMVQVNPLKGSAEDCRRALEETGARVTEHPWLPGCLCLSGGGSLEGSPLFREGRFTVQDPASRLAALAAGPRPGMRVMDLCAAPGGKSFACAMEMEDRGEILACDYLPRKESRIREGAKRLGLTCVRPQTADGRVFRPEWEGAFDLVLVDAPCSGLGVIRKKPDIRWKEPEPLEGLPEKQRALLRNGARYVRPGGTLLYSTCTLLPRENDGVTEAFLAERPEFTKEGFVLPGPAGEVPGGSITLLPHIHGTDGFYICRMRREESA